VEGISDRLHFGSGLRYDRGYAESELLFRAPGSGEGDTLARKFLDLGWNDLITKEVGVNDGRFMAKAMAAK
jgi:hypothetical protein